MDIVALILGEDQVVVEVNKYKPVDHVSKHITDECLEDRLGVRNLRMNHTPPREEEQMMPAT